MSIAPQSVVLQVTWLATSPWCTHFCTCWEPTSSTYSCLCYHHSHTYTFGVGCTSQTLCILPPDILWTGLKSCRCISHILQWAPHNWYWHIHSIFQCHSLPWKCRYLDWTGSTSCLRLWTLCLWFPSVVVVWRWELHSYYFLWYWQFLTWWVSSLDSGKFGRFFVYILYLHYLSLLRAL